MDDEVAVSITHFDVLAVNPASPLNLKYIKAKSYFGTYFSRQRINQRTKQVRATPLMNDTQ